MSSPVPLHLSRSTHNFLRRCHQKPCKMSEVIAPVDQKRRLRVPQLAIPFGLLIILSMFLLHNFSSQSHVLRAVTQGPPLTVLTLLFGETNHFIDKDLVAHNCALISQSRHHFIIYTDNNTHPFCNRCTCRPFAPVNCQFSCADPDKPGCNHCEKLLFVRDAVMTFGEFVFLDSDLIIAKESFLDRLSFRTIAHDFLATYGFRGTALQESYEAAMNSGVFFMRRIRNLNYTKMMDLMDEMNTNNDQSVITSFVKTHYENWDSLSRKWNCRLSYIRRENYPLHECYTFHGRGGVDGLLQQVGKKILAVD